MKYRSRLTILVLAVMAAAVAASRPAQAIEAEIPLTSVSFGSTKILFAAAGIQIVGQCISSFSTAGLSGDDVPSAGDHVAWMILKNVSATGSVIAAVKGADLDFGPSADEDHEDFHGNFVIGKQLTQAVASISGSGTDLTPAGNTGFVYEADGEGISVENAVAGLNVLGANCVFAADLDIQPLKKFR